MRMFGSDRIAGIMDRLGLKEGEMIQHSMITKSIERAQKKVEENNFGIRKRLLDYDNVMNSQRDVIYKRRQHALFGERLALDVQNMIYDVCSIIVQENYQARDYEGFKYELLSVLAVESPFEDQEFLNGKVESLSERLYDTVYQTYMKKRTGIAERAYPLVKNVFETQKQFENILIPFSDGKRQYTVISSLSKAYENKLEIPMAMEKNISLSVIDNSWKEHLREMDDLRQSVQNATYEQKDPLIIYKLESFGLFKTLIQDVNKTIATFLLRCNIPEIQHGAPPVRQINRAQAKMERKDMLTQAHSDTQAHQHLNQPVRVEKTVGRNEPCPCGSGKKYKHCHGQGG
jgi:preprotein translocase subunit SecA